MSHAQTARASPAILKNVSHKTTEKMETPAERVAAIIKYKRRPLLVACGIVVILLLGLVLSNRGGIARHPNMAAFAKPITSAEARMI